MHLSPEQEDALIRENMAKIYRSVDNFMARGNGRNSPVQITYDECVQEVCIAFLEYIRKCDTEEKLKVFPWYDALHAMSKLVLQYQPINVRHKRTTGFRKVINSIPTTVSFDVLATNGIDVDGMSKNWVPDTETKLDFESFLDGQDESVQRIASMMLYGMTRRNIADQFGVCQFAIDKKISKLRQNYDEFIKDGENDE